LKDDTDELAAGSGRGRQRRAAKAAAAAGGEQCGNGVWCVL
jgi:hypothetical protein